MCGIFGFLHKDVLDDVMIERGIAANNTLTHRGPDGEGVWFDKNVGIFLSHRRLSIIDLDQRSSQPMRRDDLVISFNGEIYNYIEIKDELISSGHTFQTESDTEVILAAYQEWGEQCLDRFDGMFAFALWDTSKQSLWLVRDPFGEKPLYWAKLDDGIYFASEIKALKSMKSLSADESEERVIEYFYNGFYRAPYTYYNNVFNLPPGHSVWVDSEGNAKCQAYWKPQDVRHEVNRDIQDEEIVEEANTLLHRSMERRLRADVPVGVFLSGGIDSSLIAALIKDLQADLTCYTVSFPGEVEDESEYAKQVAKHLNVKHEVIPYEVGNVEELLHTSLHEYDQPNSNWAILPLFILHSEVRKRVTVAISGQGGDEVFYGYGKYQYIQKYKNWFTIPYPLRSMTARLAQQIWGKKRSSSFSSTVGVKDLANIQWAVRNHTVYNSHYSQFENKIINQPFQSLLEQGYSLSEASRMFDVQITQPEVQIASIDRSSMKYSLEIRTPFLQRDLFHCAEQLPYQKHVQENQSKWILRKLLSKYFPVEFFERKKQGFTPPMAQWVRDGYLESYLFQKDIPIMPKETIQMMLQEHKEKQFDYSTILYRIASFNVF